MSRKGCISLGFCTGKSFCSGEGFFVKEKRHHYLFSQPTICFLSLMSGCLQGAGSRIRKKGKQLQLVLTGNSSLCL